MNIFSRFCTNLERNSQNTYGSEKLKMVRAELQRTKTNISCKKQLFSKRCGVRNKCLKKKGATTRQTATLSVHFLICLFWYTCILSLIFERHRFLHVVQWQTWNVQTLQLCECLMLKIILNWCMVHKLMYLSNPIISYEVCAMLFSQTCHHNSPQPLHWIRDHCIQRKTFPSPETLMSDHLMASDNSVWP
jgi:hypothetical protein